MIHLTQYMCPKRHAVLAAAWDDTAITAAEAQADFALRVELLHLTSLRRRCEVCNEAVEFHFEDGVTGFETMEEARPHLLEMERAQIATRQFLIASRN